MHVKMLYIVFVLSHCGLVMPYGVMDLVKIGSGYGLLPDAIKT